MGRSEPFFASGAITTDAAAFSQSPVEVMDVYLAAVSRPTPAPPPAKRGLLGRRGPMPTPEFRMTMHPGPLGWEFDGGYYGLTAWIFVLHDGRSLLMISPWYHPSSAGWPYDKAREIFEPMTITVQTLGGDRIRDTQSTKEHWRHQLQAVVGESTIVTPRDIEQLRP